MRFRLFPFSLLWALLALMILVAPARAGNYVVTNTYDDTNITNGSLCSLQPDACTLRGALYAASENPDADTIRMGNSAFVQNLNGPLPVIKTDVTLSSGVGTKLQANGFYRLLRVERGATLRLSGFQLVNGQTLDFGGAINSSGTLIVSNCLFRDNRVGNINSGGGAVSNFGGSATLNNCEFNNNFVRANGSSSSIGDGGAVVSDGGTLEINRCLFVGNSAGALGIASGGAVAMRGGALSIFNSEFRGNSAQNGGGAVSVNDASATLSGVTFRDNSTTNRDAAEAVGGALYFADSGARTLSLSNGTFVGNSANSGGAVANYGASNALSLNYCTLVGNTARARGGAIEFAQGGGRISNSIVAGNAAPAAPNISGSLAASSNFNLVAASVAATGLQTDSSGAAILKDNGGPIAGRVRDGNAYADYSEQSVSTVALTVSSPAVDAGGTVIATDARRVARPQGGASDQGAFELTGDDIPYSDTTTQSFIVTTIADSFVSGQTTLRDAILASNFKSGVETIRFAPGVSGTINLNKVLPDLSSVTIVGPGVDVVSVRPATAGAFRIFNVPSSATVTLGGLTLTLGQSSLGGALRNAGNTTLSGCRLTGNAATDGGAIDNAGILSLNNCLFGANSATKGGAIYNRGILTIATCQLTANTARDGGGALFNLGRLAMTDSLFNANIASGTSDNDGGGAWLDYTVLSIAADAPVTVSNCTFSGNTTAARGGAIRFYSSGFSSGRQRAITLDSLTITRNRGNVGGLANDNQISATGFTLRNSVIAASTSDGAAGVSYVGPTTGTNNFLSGDPKLGPLQDNGGPLQTIAPRAGSPLINAGATALATDARGVARPQFKFADIGAVEISAADGILSNSLVVTTITDEDNGTSDPAFGAGTSLREAIERANSDGKDSVITFAPSVFATRQTINLALGELVLGADGKLTLDAPTAGLAISAGGRSRVLNIASGADVALSGLQITGGVSDQFGQGAGIYNAGTLALRNATINGNSTSGKGAGIYNAGTATFSNVTVTGNINYIYSDALSGGGGAYNLGTLNLVNCTVADNQSALRGGAINNAGGTVTLRNTLFAQNNQDDTDLIGVPNPGSGGDANGNFRFGSLGEAGLSALADNGGQVPTMALSGRAPVLNRGVDTTGSPSNLTTDARGAGFARKIGAGVDVGAFELQQVPESQSLVVNTTADVRDDFDGLTSLRDAVNFANSNGAGGAITFDPNAFGTRQTIKLNGTPLTLSASNRALSISAPAAGLTISGDDKSRLFDVTRSAFVTLNDLTLTGGFSAEAGAIVNQNSLTLNRVTVTGNRSTTGAGAIYNDSGFLTINNSTISSNSASSGTSGAITTIQGGSVRLNNSTLSGNSCTPNSESIGAGALLVQQFGSARLLNATVAGNTLSGSGQGAGGLANQGDLTLVNVTAVGNAASQFGALSNFGSLEAINSLFAANGATPFNGFTDPGASGDANRNYAFATLNAAGLDADGLKNNGGTVATIALLGTSPVRDQGQDTTQSPYRLSTDARGSGFARLIGAGVDVGAFEAARVNSAPGLDDASYSGTTGVSFSQQLAGSDAENDAITYSLTSGALPDGLTLNESGLISGTPTTAGSATVTVTVSDGVASDAAQITINIAQANRAPTVSPTITPASPTTNQTITVAPNGADADGNSLSYVYTFRVNGVQKQSGAGASFDLSIAGQGDRGDTISAEVVANDGTTDSTPVTVSVTVVNGAPNLGDAAFKFNLNATVSQQLAGTDPDGDALNYSITAGQLPLGLTLSSDGLLAGRVAQSGTFVVTVTVSDGNGGSDTAQITVNVVSPAGTRDNIAPSFITDAPQEGATLTYAQLIAGGVLGRIVDVAPQGVTPSGVRQLLGQLRRRSDNTVWDGAKFTRVASLRNAATLGAPDATGVRSWTLVAPGSSGAPLLPPASQFAPGDYQLLLTVQDNNGNSRPAIVNFTLVGNSVSSALKAPNGGSGGAS